MSSEINAFLLRCEESRDAGYRFLGMQTSPRSVAYVFELHGELLTLEQPIDEGTVHSIAQLFPLADFAERQMFRDRNIKAIGNANLLPRKVQA